MKRYSILAVISISIISTLACNLPMSMYEFFIGNSVKDTRDEEIMADYEEDWNMDVVADPTDTNLPITFSGKLSFTCDQWVGDGGDSEGMGKIPLDVNFDSGDFYGSASFSYVKDNGKTSTSTFLYQGVVSQEGVLIGSFNMSTTVDNVDVGFVGGDLAAFGIVAEDGKGLHLYTYQESNTEMLQLFKDGRDAVLSKFLEPSVNCN